MKCGSRIATEPPDFPRHTVSILAENRPGVLSRIACIFSGNALNIDALSMGSSAGLSTTLITVAFQSDAGVACRIVGKIEKLIDVIRVDRPPGSVVRPACADHPSKNLRPESGSAPSIFS